MSGAINLGMLAGGLAGAKMADPDSMMQQVVFAAVGAITLGAMYRAAVSFCATEDRRRAEAAKGELGPP